MDNINEILAEQNIDVLISKLKNGRKVTIDFNNIETYRNEINPAEHKINKQSYRPDKRVRIVKDDGSEAWRTEKVARIPLALQKLIVNRAVAFCFGNPETINCEPQDEAEEKVLTAVKKVLQNAKTRKINNEIANDIFSVTEAAELWYLEPNKHKKYGFESDYKIKVAVFSPLRGDLLYPYFNDSGDLIAFSREYRKAVNEKGSGTKTETYFETYTADEHYVWKADGGKWQLEPGYPKKMAIGKIPVVYGSQPNPEWADVEPLIERMEKTLSNFADTNDYHAAPKIFTTGTILGWAEKGESGAVIQGDSGATAQYLSWAQAPQSVQTEIDTLLRFIYTITQTPDISFENVRGLAVSGVALELMFTDAHLKVQRKKTEIFDEYLQRRISIILAFLSKINAKDKEFTNAIDNILIEPEITPFSIKDEASLVSLLMTANGNKAIVSRQTAVQKLGWVHDTENEINKINEEEQQGQQEDLFNPTM